MGEVPDEPCRENPADASVSRRSVLRATAASAIGTATLTGTATAEGPKLLQVNFCGCSQVCVVREEDDGDESFKDNGDDAESSNNVGPNTVVLARKERGSWTFRSEIYETGYFCDDSGDDGGWKIIGVYAAKEDPIPDNPACFVCNPTPCARKALAEYFTRARKAKCVNGEPPSFGTFTDTCGDKSYRISVVRGRCGTPGRDPPQRGPPS